ncbi:hypothetical protein XELAEV_18014557mg [Xenopus laevis]|uniref:Uncharacterized protein n=1 Tax=Xenopus laevis TaxID=8355 RepID=A0A974HV27_XENLA|nr:hypothetical protein XELAEV_18014557mg [Xenopus laevis]
MLDTNSGEADVGVMKMVPSVKMFAFKGEWEAEQRVHRTLQILKALHLVHPSLNLAVCLVVGKEPLGVFYITMSKVEDLGNFR